MRRGERKGEPAGGPNHLGGGRDRSIVRLAENGRTDRRTDGRRGRGRGERCRHRRRRPQSTTEEGRNGGTSGRRWDEEGSQCINNITSSEASSPPSKPTNHLAGERPTPVPFHSKSARAAAVAASLPATLIVPPARFADVGAARGTQKEKEVRKEGR